MTYVSDKLYREVVTKMMARLASYVKVREIMPHLPCLTLTDKEEIEAKREMAGNYSAMVLLLDNLRRRENWPEEFIQALRACEHRTLADEISNAYDQIRGINRQAPVAAAAPPVAATAHPVPATARPVTAAPTSPLTTMHATGPAPSRMAAAPVPMVASTTVTTATVHTVPHSASPLLTPEGLPAQAALIESVPNIAPPVHAKAHASVLAPESPAPLPPEPAFSADPLLPVSAPQERPPSPVLACEDIFSVEQTEISVSPGATPALGTLSSPPSDAGPCLPTKSLTTPLSLSKTQSTTLQPSAAPENSQEPMAATGSPSSFKHPIQDSHPSGKVTVLTQNSKYSSTIKQPVDMVHTTVTQNSQALAASLGTAQVSSSASDNAIGSRLDNTAVEDEYLSKPGTLLVEAPLSGSSADLEINHAATGTEVSPMQPAPVSNFPQAEELLQEPCSITSADLMISSATTETIGTSPVQHTEDLPLENSFHEVVSDMLTESVPDSNPGPSGNSISNSTHEVSAHLENGFPLAPSSNQPVEDHYESFCLSLQSQSETLVNTVSFSENPSIPNLDGCSQRMQGNVIDKNDKPVSPNLHTHFESVIQPVIVEHQSTLNNQSSSGLNASAMITTPQSEQREEVKEGLLAQLQSDPRLIAAAAVIGVTAVFFAWKFKYKY